MSTQKKHLVPLSACRKAGRCQLPDLLSPYSVNVSFAASSTLSPKTFQARGLSTLKRKDRYVEATVVQYLSNLDRAPVVEDYNGARLVLPDAAQLGTIHESQIYFFGPTSKDYTAILTPRLQTSGSIVLLETQTIEACVDLRASIDLIFVAVLKYLAV
jgi:hypothetical protein